MAKAKEEKQEKEISKLDWVLKDLWKAFPGSVKTGKEVMENKWIEFVSSWSRSLDIALGGWYAKGKFVEIFWVEGSMKTTTCILAMVAAQKRGEKVVFADAEAALNLRHAELLWLKVEDIIYVEGSCWDDILQTCLDLAETWEVWLIVLDSIAACTPRAELEWNVWDQFMWIQARMMNQFIRKATPIFAKNEVPFLMINQIRATMDPYASINTTWGKGKAYAAFHRIYCLKPKVVEWWMTARYKMHKSKANWLGWSADVDVIRWEGYDAMLDLLNAWVTLWVITKWGSWYNYWNLKVQWVSWLKKLTTEQLTTIEKDVDSKIEALRDWARFKKNKVSGGWEFYTLLEDED